MDEIVNDWGLDFFEGLAMDSIQSVINLLTEAKKHEEDGAVTISVACIDLILSALGGLHAVKVKDVRSEDGLIDAKELAALCGVTVQTIHSWNRRGWIRAFWKNQKTAMYSYDEVVEALNARKQGM